MLKEVFITGTKQHLWIPVQADCPQCKRGACPAHNPSNHHMREWRTHWRADRSILERLCPQHGCGHPDPDCQYTGVNTVHGCCGDCTIQGYVENLRNETPCAHCGKSPIEYHHPDHPEKENDRVSSLVAQSNPSRPSPVKWSRIAEEIARCIPLCRSCHMKEDGRLETLLASAPYKKGQIYVPPAPCLICAKVVKPLRRGLCWGCSEQHRPKSRYFKHLYYDGCCIPPEVYDERETNP